MEPNRSPVFSETQESDAFTVRGFSVTVNLFHVTVSPKTFFSQAAYLNRSAATGMCTCYLLIHNSIQQFYQVQMNVREQRWLHK